MSYDSNKQAPENVNGGPQAHLPDPAAAREIPRENRPKPEVTLVRVEIPVVQNDTRPLEARKKRQPKKEKQDEGLANRPVAEALYRTYRAVVDAPWRALVGTELLPELNANSISLVLDGYEQRHRQGHVDTEAVEEKLKARGVKTAGMIYPRFSCDQSQDTSNEDQMVECLRRANADGVFVPFDFICPDFALSGLNDNRPGYRCIRHAIEHAGPVVKFLYISEFSRASRNAAEWDNLYFLCKANQKVLIGALDNFDSRSEDAEERIASGSFANRQEKNRRVQAIQRGRKGALRRGTSLGAPPIGFTLRQAVDAQGQLRFKKNRTPINEWVIDPQSKDLVLEIYDLFVRRKWSLAKIAKHLNEKKADGRTGWKANTVKQILQNATYVGTLIRYRYSWLRDPKTGKLVRIENPRSKWFITYREDWVLVDKQIWAQAQRRLGEIRRGNKLTGKKWSRPERNPRDLFDGLLFRACCHNLITLSRSGEEAQYGAASGSTNSHECHVKTSKRVRIVRQVLLDYAKHSILSEEMVELLVNMGNERLADEARREAPDPQPIRDRIAARRIRMKNLASGMGEASTTELRRDLEVLHQEEAALNLKDKQELEAALAKRESDPVRLSLDDARRAFEDMASLLQQDIPRAAHMLRGLLGPIMIHEEPSDLHPGEFRWVATFTPRWADTIASLVPERVAARIKKVVGELGTPARVVIERGAPLYQSLAPEIKSLRAKGMNNTQIARQIKKSTTVVKDALAFIDHGTIQVPRSQRTAKQSKPRLSDVHYKDIATDVLRMRDVEHRSFPKIAKHFKTSRGLVERAYRWARQQASNAGGDVATPIKRVPQLSKKVFEVIRALADSDLSTAEIAKRAGCSHQTASRNRRKFRTRAA